MRRALMSERIENSLLATETDYAIASISTSSTTLASAPESAFSTVSTPSDVEHGLTQLIFSNEDASQHFIFVPCMLMLKLISPTVPTCAPCSVRGL